MIFATPNEGLKGRQIIARGNAPGTRATKSQALKGRNKSSEILSADFCAALSGLDWSADDVPRALRWAIILRPFGAVALASSEGRKFLGEEVPA